AMRPANPLPFGFAVAGGRQRCSAREWNNHSLRLAPWRPSRHGKRRPADYCEHALAGGQKKATDETVAKYER
ncbi:MAG TPA: hypothetical protein PLN02_05920, partial [Azonexus sp.]|nr:hypothetical protein [Azonexus sp.]